MNAAKFISSNAYLMNTAREVPPTAEDMERAMKAAGMTTNGAPAWAADISPEKAKEMIAAIDARLARGAGAAKDDVSCNAMERRAVLEKIVKASA